MNNVYSKVINSMKSTISEGRLFFIKGNYQFLFPNTEITTSQFENTSFIYKYYRYNCNLLQDSYEPVMDWIRDIYYEKFSSKMTIRQFINECNVYSLQIETFCSYIKNKKCIRSENFILCEIKYEKRRFIESIISIIKYIAKSTQLILILDGFQFANSSIMQLILELTKIESIPNFSLLIYYYINSNPLDYAKNDWNNLIEQLEKLEIIEDYSNISFPNHNYLYTQNEYSLNQMFNSNNIFEVIDRLENMIYMLSIKQAHYYLHKAFTEITSNKLIVNVEAKQKILILYILVNIYQTYTSIFIISQKKEFYYIKYLCEELKNLCNDKNSYIYYCYNNLLCMISHIENKKDVAYKHYNICKEYAQKTNDSSLDFKADLVYYFFLCYDKSAITIKRNCMTPEEIELTKKVEDAKLYNTLIYMYMYNYECDDESISAISKGKANFVYLEKAVDLARKLDNKYFLELAYGRKSVYYNSTKIDDLLFKKDTAMLKELNIPLSYQKYSFIAYRYTMTEEYLLSHKTNNELLIKMYENLLIDNKNDKKVYINDILEFLICIYNIAMNCMCANEYTYASNYLIFLIKEIEKLNLYDLSVCDLAKLYGMLAYCFCKRDLEYKCSLFLKKLKKLISFGFKYEDSIILGKNKKIRRDSMFLYHITLGSIYLKDNLLKQAKKEIQLAYRHFLREKGQWPFMYPIITNALYELYTKTSEHNKAKKSLINCIRFCQKNSLPLTKDYFESVLNNSIYIRKKYTFDLKGITKEQIDAVLKKKRLEIKLNNYNTDFEFISLWNNNLNNKNKIDNTLINNSMEIIENYLNTNNILYLTISESNNPCEENQYKIIKNYINIDTTLEEEDFIDIANYFINNNSSFIIRICDENFTLYNNLMKMLKTDEILSLLCIPLMKNQKVTNIFIAYSTLNNNELINNQLFEKSKLAILNIALNQLIDSEKIYHSKQKLAIALDKANSANRAKSDFLANMSHEIRTPLNSILGMDEIILRESNDKNIIEYASNIKLSGNALLSLINELLDFSKIEAGRMEIVPVEYEINSLLYDLYNMSIIRAQKKNIELIMDIDESIPYKIFGDDIRLRQIITNLLTNGIKYTQEGSVTLHVHWKDNNNGYLTLLVSVEDTGIGIKKEDISKLFHSFQRLELERNRNIEGTGLGIVITVKLLKMMGSDLKVESTYGKGSIFSFELTQKIIDSKPMGNLKSQIDEIIKESKSYTKKFTAPNAKVLVVDDNDMNRIVFSNLLKPTKIQVSSVESGFECLEIVKNTKFDLIFLDHMMPLMNGIETLEKLKNQEDNLCKDCPIIVLTANAISGAREMYLDKGFNNYLSKPINIEKLESLLMDYLPNELIFEYTVEEELTETKVTWDSIPGIDINEAMKHNTDESSFKQLLKLFYMSINTKADLIEKYEEEELINDYTIQVHALKSSAKLIGATVISELAARLEQEGNNNNVEIIHKDTKLLLLLYRKYIELLKPFVCKEEDNDKQEVSITTIIDKLKLIKESISNFDLNTSDKTIEELNKFKLPKKIEDDFELLKKYVLDFKVEETPELVNTIIKKLN